MEVEPKVDDKKKPLPDISKIADAITAAATKNNLAPKLNNKYLQNISLAVDLTKLEQSDYTRYTNDSIKTMYDKKMAGLSLKDVGKELERFSSALSLLGMDKNYREDMRVIMGKHTERAIKDVKNKAEKSRQKALEEKG